MKTFLSCSLAGAVLLAQTAYAGGGMEGYGVPSNMDFYGGGSIGMAKQDGACRLINGGSNCESSGTGYKLFAGARLTPNPQYTSSSTLGYAGENPPLNSQANSTYPTLGVEGGYINFGESSATGTLLSNRGGVIGNTAASDELTGLYAAGTVSMPVAPRTEVMAKAGVLRWNQESTASTSPFLGGGTSQSSSKSGFGTLLGVGAQYQLMDNISIRGEYEQGFGVGDGNTETSPSLLSVGAVFSTL